MINVDKYREAILSGDPEELPCHIAAIRRHTEPCDGNSCLDCMQKNHIWFFSEHEPQLLKNGDGLKPGDRIMVRDNEDSAWVNRRFLFYYDGIFYCELVDSSIGNGEYISWKQARLPMEGE